MRLCQVLMDQPVLRLLELSEQAPQGSRTLHLKVLRPQS